MSKKASSPNKFFSRGKGKNRKVIPLSASSGRRRRKLSVASNLNPTDQYVRGEITEAQWRRKMNAEKRKNAMPRAQVLAIVRDREVAQGYPAKYEDRFNGYTNWDTWETMLILENTAESDRWLGEWRKNFDKKIEAGTFDPVEAEKAVERYLVPAARRESSRRQFGSDFTPDPNIDPKKVNKAEVVRMLLEHGE